MKQKKKQVFIISGVILVLVALLGFAAWFITRPEEGRKEVVSSKELNVEWYDENGTEFTLTTAEELFEFAALSAEYDFYGQTIKLGADIVVNEGDANEWEDVPPEVLWDHPIEGFAGTFDGQGHTISGIYGVGYLYKVDATGLTQLPAGMFFDTKSVCVIKNFKLVNSYFEGDVVKGSGIISAYGGGTFDSIYTDAILNAYKYWNGGIIGCATESTTITNCWFDGQMNILGGFARYSGGIMGRSMNADADFRIEHCLVTATMYNETTGRGVGMGALLGNAYEASEVTINDCFVAADLTNEFKLAVGSVYGVSEKNATVNLTNTYATNESYEQMVGAILGTANGMPTGYPEEMLKGYGGYQWTTLDFENYWSVVEDGTPILTTFADSSPSLEGIERYVDTSWYTADATEYVLYDKADLYGFSILSQSWNFEGKTVKLGADIVINEGKASTWGKEAPALEWICISPKKKPFAGTFDGQMHTISGLYINTDEANTGLFSVTGDTSTIKNLKLKNSYIKTGTSFTGSIAGQGRGTFDTVYSDATVISSQGSVGGLIGLGYGTKVSMKNCWFAGSVTNTANETAQRGTGGMIGTLYDNGSAKIENCLNTGTIDVRSYTYNQNKSGKNITPIAGGLVGWVRTEKTTLDITGCLNTGKVLVSSSATGGYGSILGYTKGVVTVTDTYATTESCALTAKNIKGWVLAFEETKLTGYEGYRWTTLDFNKYWSATEKGTPVLTSFAGRGVSVSNVARMVDTSWYDAKKDTYVLSDVADLYGMAYLSNGTDFAEKTIKLGADIVVNSGNASDWANAAPEYEWLSISPKSMPFAGTFDGQMHTISGLYINTDATNSGLFGVTADTSTIKNLKLTNSYIKTAASFTGSIAGQGRGTFDTVYSDALVVSSQGSVGGLIGLGYGTKVSMKNCWFSGSVTNTANEKTQRGTGGLIGTLYDDGSAKIEGCLNTGIIDVTAYTYNQAKDGKNITPIAGGLVGWVRTKKSTLDITDCLNTGKILVNASATGGYGAIVGYTANTDGTTVSTTYSTVSPSTGNKITGKVYKVAETDITGYKGYQWTFLDFDKYWAVVETSTPILKSFASNVPSLAVERMIDISWLKEADGSEKNPYIMSTKQDLYGLAMLSVDADYAGFKGKTIKLANDIVMNTGDMSSWNEWTPIGSKSIPFAGTFDGQMHTISGLYIDTDAANSGLFSATGTTSTIKNLKLAADCYIKSTTNDLGSIAGQGRGVFDTIKSEATVIGSNARVGGLIGMGYGTEVVLKNCWFAGSVTNTGNHKDYRGTGGLIGAIYDSSSAKIENCLNTGTIDVTGYTYNQNATGTNITPIAGGLVGWVRSSKSSVDIQYCLSTKSVLASDNATGGYGPIVGYSDNVAATTVFRTYATADASTGGKVTGNIFEVSEADITGYKGYQWTLLDFTNNWAVVEANTPILKSFASNVPSLKDVEKMVDISWITETEGSESKPYILSDKTDLYGLAALSQEPANEGFADKFFKLNDDIVVNTGNASDWAKNAPEYKWTPIGSEKVPFAGTFDGQMHAISGIYLPGTTARRNGMFSATNGDATIKNLKLTNSYFNTTHDSMGSIVGYAQGEFDTIYSDAIVASSSTYAGGLFGMVAGTSKINKCWFDGEVKNTSTGTTQTGGIMGIAYAGTSSMSDCLFSGTVDVSASTKKYPKAGGFCGDVYKSNLTFTDCLTVGTILTSSTCQGGMFAGCIDGSTVISNTSYGTGYKVGNTTITVGYLQNKSTFTVNYVLNGTSGSADKSYNNGSVGNVPVVTSTRTFVGAKAATSLEGYDFENTWSVDSYSISTPVLKAFEDEIIDTSWYDASKDTYVLKDSADLYGLAVLSQNKAYNGFANKTIQLGADIVINEGDADEWANSAPKFNWLPIGNKDLAFAGTFDGQMHTISGIYQPNTTAKRNGLFARTSATAKVKNLKLTNSYFNTTHDSVGSIVGYAQGEFDTIYSDAIVVSSSTYAGGLFGMAAGTSTINNCWFAGTMKNTSTGTTQTGGIIGIAYAATNINMNNCLFSGTVDVSASTKTYPKAGGFCGDVYKSKLTLTDCLTVGTILTSSSCRGGMFAGCIDGSTVISNTSYGTGYKDGDTTITVGYLQNKSTFTINYVLNGTSGSADRSYNNGSVGNVPVVTSTRTFTGETAKTSLEGFDFTDIWSTTEGTPVLKKLAE